MDRRDLARQELARRELARRDLVAFSWYTYRGYEAGDVHRLLGSYLQQVERYVATGGREGIGRLMVFMPPRHGKSEMVSVRFPAWFLGRNPDKRVILTSCTAGLATGFSRQVRNIIADEPFQALWGAKSGRDPASWVRIADDSRAAEAWELANARGGLTAAGVGGSIIGRGAHVAIIDDPFKDRNDVERESVREHVDDWYRSTLYTRLEDGGAVVLMHQRWHADDLAGRLIQRMIRDPGSDQWTVLALPALAEPWAEAPEVEEVRRAMLSGWWMAEDALGRAPEAPLWPEKYDAEALGTIRRNIGGYEWAALYQQRPQRREGALIPAHEIRRVRPDQVPDDVQEVRYWDLAVSGRERADYIAGARLAFTKDSRLYIRHIDHRPGPWSTARSGMIDVMLRDPARVRQGVEVAGQQGGYYQELVRDPALMGRSLEAVSPREVGSKEVRAQVWASRIQDNLVYIVDDGTWDVEGFVDECLAFPNGSHDDRVDGVSGAVQMLGGWMGHMSDVPQDDGGRSLFEERVPDFSFAGMGAIEW